MLSTLLFVSTDGTGDVNYAEVPLDVDALGRLDILGDSLLGLDPMLMDAASLFTDAPNAGLFVFYV